MTQMIPALVWDSVNQRIELSSQPATTLTRLRTAIVISLFTDARAEASEVPADNQNRGYWGDLFLAESMGSKLWTLQREKLTQPTLNRSRDYIQQAVQWLIDNGDLLAVNITVERQGTQRLAYQLDCQLANDTWEKIVMEQEYGI